MTENESNTDTNTYFKQLKNQIHSKIENKDNSKEFTKKENELFVEKEKILNNIKKTKELPPPNNPISVLEDSLDNKLKMLSSNKTSSFDKLKEITKKQKNIDLEKKQEEIEISKKTNTPTETLELDSKENKLKNEKIKNDEPELNPLLKTRNNDGKDLDWIKQEIIEEPRAEDFLIKKEDKWPKKKKSYNDEINEELKEIQKQREETTIPPNSVNSQNVDSKFDSNKAILEEKKENQIKFQENVKQENIEKEIIKDSILIQKNETKKEDSKIKKNYKTPIDEVFETLEIYKKIDSGEIAKQLNMDYPALEKIGKLFEEEGIIEIQYPTSLNKKPTYILKNSIPSRLTEKPLGQLIETYELIVDKVPATISIILSKEENRPVYCIETASVGTYTKKYLDFVKTEIAESMPIELDEILDPKKAQKLKERFFEESRKKLAQFFPTIPNNTLELLSGVILHDMYGLGEIELLMGDEMLEEVAINSAKTPITVYHRIHGWLKTNMLPGNEEEIMNYSSQIGRKVGREITTLNPILDAHLLSGDRVNATLFPISAEGNTITIRRFARRPWTIIDFIGRAHTMNTEMAALLWLAMQYEMNVIIAGGTASGKTSALNTMLSLIPAYHRIISIEDVREIVLPKFLSWNWIPMVTRSPNPEGLGEVTMLDCMISSLRMRPDRIIVGEIRRKKEAEVLMEAIETGHSIYSTIHSNSAYQVLRRLSEPPMSIPLMQIELIDLIVVQFRDRKTNKRRTFEIAEIEQTSTGKGLQINTIYKWVPRTDNWEKLNKPNKILTMLNLHTGLTEEEINKELKEREKILEWMKKNKITELDTIGFVVKLFYTNREKVKKMMEENTSLEEITEMLENTK